MSAHITGNKPAEGFLLLTIPNVNLTSTSPAHRISPPSINQRLNGVLSLECVTIPVEHPMERDVWLVLRVEPPSKTVGEPFELALPSEQKIILSRANNQYTLPMHSGGELVLTLPQATTTGQKEDLETLEVILAQYAVVEADTGVAGPYATSDLPPSKSFDPPSSQKSQQYLPPTSPPSFTTDPDLKGRLVLVDEDNGQVLGALDDEFIVREDTGLRSRGHEKDPVIVEIPDDELLDLAHVGPGAAAGGKRKVRQEIFVHTIEVDGDDWVSKTAGFVGRGMVMATNAVSTGITHGANYYINHSAPSPKPMQFSDTTQKNFKRVHNISGIAVKVTSKTTGLIHRTVETLADRVVGRKDHTQSNPHLQHHPSYGIGAGLGAGAAVGVPYGHGAYSPAPSASKDGSMHWSSPYPGSTQSLQGHEPPPYALAPSFASAPAGPATPYAPYTPRTPGTPGTMGEPGGPPPLPPRKKLLNRLLTSTDMLLTTLESSAHHLISHTTNSVSMAAGHKYGDEAERAVKMMGDSVRNVGVVYVDVRGVGRRALLRVAGKRVLKARLGGRDVVFEGQEVGKGVVKSEGGGGGNPPYMPGTYSPPVGPPPTKSGMKYD